MDARRIRFLGRRQSRLDAPRGVRTGEACCWRRFVSTQSTDVRPTTAAKTFSTDRNTTLLLAAVAPPAVQLFRRFQQTAHVDSVCAKQPMRALAWATICAGAPPAEPMPGGPIEGPVRGAREVTAGADRSPRHPYARSHPGKSATCALAQWGSASRACLA